ncbi:MAG: hypothetical protein CMI62_04700 [Parvibaculum sp.]|jgi:hypothetical protein|uniref:DUF6134 family protein n=1 Tax=Parvibaculum sp. TaxID=2024848 RepID=UPI000C4F1392|nr:DUF6134 family protein [Parvibaculum sp.]MAU60015.1 hypothetical protein [Parvibaculum sp.]|tara:strand:+ start:832 stop:1482 length:651 start_codon:yes stop_codon:yes gene_type:complete
MNRKPLFAAFAASMFLLSGVNAASAAAPSGGELDFTVLRGDDEIGTHRLVFTQDGDELKVKIDTNVAVKMLGIAVYRFEHDGSEIWRDGHLVSLESKTNDDGTPHRLEVKEENGKLVVDGDGRQGTEQIGVIPASLWNDNLVKQTALLNTLDGSSMPVTVGKLGTETVEVNGKPVAATHYSVTGKLNRELWYDENGVLVQVRFAGADGSEITYVLR